MWTDKLSFFLMTILTVAGRSSGSAAGVSTPTARSLQKGEPPAAAEGSYWAIYNATTSPAADSCLVTEGESVEVSCCEEAGKTMPHAMLKGNDTCFQVGPGTIPFSGCVGDGTYGYGEDCVTEKAPFVAANAEECGCAFIIEGTGCYKANDIPGEQWFVFLDGDSCSGKTMMEEEGATASESDDGATTTPAPGPSSSSSTRAEGITAGNGAFVAIVLLGLAVV